MRRNSMRLIAFLILLAFCAGCVNSFDSEAQPNESDALTDGTVYDASDKAPSTFDNLGDLGYEPALPYLRVDGGFDKLRELYALLERDDESIKEYLNSDIRYYPNGLMTREDIENLFVSLLDLYFPYLEGIEAAHVGLDIGYTEDGRAVEMPVFVSYEVNDIIYIFTLSASSNWGNRPGPTAEEVINGWDEETDGPLLLLSDRDGVSIYLWRQTDDGRITFIMDVQGVYTVAICHTNNIVADEALQSAIDGIMAFEFKPLMD